MQTLLTYSSTLFALGHYFIAGTFILSGLKTLTSWDQGITFLKTKDIPFERLILTISILWQLLGGGLLLLSGWQRAGCILLILYTAFAGLRFYPFWRMSNVEQYINTIFFLTNLGLIGGLLILLVEFSRNLAPAL